MADRELIGNCAQWLLCGGSLAVWGLIVARKVRRFPVLEPIETSPVSWPVAPVGATFLVAYLLPQLLMLLGSNWFGPWERVTLAVVQWRCLCMVAQVITVVGLLAIAGPLKKGDFGCTLANWRSDVLVGTCGCLASIVPIFVLTTWQQFLNWRGPDDKNALLRMLDESSERGALFWIILSAAVLAPITEELLYRVLLQGWAQSNMDPWKAIAFSTFVFVVQHPPFDWLPLVPLALILGFVYNRRRSYLAVLVLHALFNGVMLGLAVLAKK